jgi:hypothetical protein
MTCPYVMPQCDDPKRLKRVKPLYLLSSQESRGSDETDLIDMIFDGITTNKSEQTINQTLVQFLQRLFADRIGSQGTRVHPASGDHKVYKVVCLSNIDFVMSMVKLYSN